MRKFAAVLLAIVVVITVIGCSQGYLPETGNSHNASDGPAFPENPGNSAGSAKKDFTESGNSSHTSEPDAGGQNSSSASTEHILKVHFLDVGQADSILVQLPFGKTMLIDAGNNDDGDHVVSYIRSQGINKIDILVGTHPHEDHIGGMDTVIRKMDVGKIYMPKVYHGTKTFEDVLLAIKSKGLKVSTAQGGVRIDAGPSVEAEILAPNGTGYESLNNYSAVIKITYGNTSFLFTGDAEAESENEMLGKGYNLKATVLKVSHHGSTTSTSAEFLKAVEPEYAVISVGKGNDYGHPHKEILSRLAQADIKTYRTDEDGTIVAISDGSTVHFYTRHSTEHSIENSTDTNPEANTKNNRENNTEYNSKNYSEAVYITKSGSKYHKAGCRYLSESRIAISVSQAREKGYSACSVCFGS